MKGIGFSGLLAILFIAFKLAGIINWSWWWVLCPLWAGIAIILGIAGIGIISIFITEYVKQWQYNRTKKKRGIKK